MSASSSLLEQRPRLGGIVATGTVLAILYFARDVLVPITLAVILSLLISPLVRRLRRLGAGATASVLMAVLLLVLACGALAAVLAVHVARMASSLPHYEHTIRDKLETLNAATVGRFNALSGQAGRLLGENPAPPPRQLPAPQGLGTLPPPASTLVPSPASAPVPASAPALASTTASAPGLAPSPGSAPAAAAAPIPVELRAPAASATQVIERILATVWVPLETALIVLVVLVFVLLEHEAVRDRFIRIAGGTDLRATTLALNDAGERLSRFFVSQFAVNFGVGLAIWVGLLILRLPHALLWGALAGALRFVPYVGVWIAALFSTVLAAAVVPGWSLAVATLGLFLIVELIAGQLVEPQLYGHTTGLSPLSVVVAAIFWSWLWGPVGLILSTPLTLCLVVAGRHIKALSLLDLLLGDTEALTMPQRFYQRALSGDSDELIGSARAFLKQRSFAAYCDMVVMPALSLAGLDLVRGVINLEQQIKVRATVVNVIEAIGGETHKHSLRRARVSVLEPSTAGQLLRRQREQALGRWQGPLTVPPGSIMLCVTLGSTVDDLATELLVRILRGQRIDARHVTLAEMRESPPPEASPDSIAILFLVSAFPNEQRHSAAAVAAELRTRMPKAYLVGVFFPGLILQTAAVPDSIGNVDKVAASFGEAAQICLDWIEEHAKPDG